MKYQKIILAGGSGYLGRVLTDYYRTVSKEIVVLSRKKSTDSGAIRTVLWDGKTEGSWVKELSSADMLINLCGKNVNCRYTQKNQKEILDSRLISTSLLGKVVGEMENPPKLWINVTSATIYQHAEDRPQDEEQGEKTF